MVDYTDPKMAGYTPLSEIEDTAREQSSRVISSTPVNGAIPFVGAAYRYYQVTFRQSLFICGPLDISLTDFALETIPGVGMAGFTVNRGGWAIPNEYAAWYNGDDSDTLVAVNVQDEATFTFDFGAIRSISNLRLVAKNPGTLGSNPQKHYPKHVAVAGSNDGVHWVSLNDGKASLLWSAADEIKDIAVCGSAVGILPGAGLTFFFDQATRLLTITADASGEGASTTAAGVVSLPHGNLAATNVQDALNELQDEKLTASALSGIIGDHLTALLDPAHPGMTEAVADRVFALLQPGSNITLEYNDDTGELTINASALGMTEPVPISLDNLSDVVIGAPVTNQVLRFNGTAWVNSDETPASAGGTVSVLMDGTTIHEAATILNFSGLVVTSSGSEVTITAEEPSGGGISEDDLSGSLAWFTAEPYRYWRIQLTNQESAATDSVQLGLRALELQSSVGVTGPVPTLQTGGMDEWFDGDPLTEGVMSWGGYAQTKIIDLDYGTPQSFSSLRIIPTEDRDQDPWLIEVLASTDDEIWTPVYEPETQLVFEDETPIDYPFDMPRVGVAYPLKTNPVGNAGKILAVNSAEDGFELVPFKPLAIADVTDLPETLTTIDENFIAVDEALALKLEDAPADGEFYARQDNAWAVVEVPSALPVLTGNEGKVLKVSVGEAGVEWADDEAGSGGGLTDAPSDGKLYGRKDAAWTEAPAPRPYVTANMQFYLSPTGNDANDGLTLATPMRQASAIFNRYLNYDFRNHSIYIEMAPGDYIGFGVPDLYGLTSVRIESSDGNPASVTISGGLSGIIQNNKVLVIYNITVPRFTVEKGTFDGDNLIFAGVAVSGEAHIKASKGAEVYVGNYTIASNQPRHIWVQDGSHVEIDSVTLTGTPAFSIAFAHADGGKITTDHTTLSGAATGVRAMITNNGHIDLYGENLAGALPGSLAEVVFHVPNGGTVGQVLAKKTTTDFETEWVDAASGGGGGLSDAPVDGKRYLRKDGAWIESDIFVVLTQAAYDALAVKDPATFYFVKE